MAVDLEKIASMMEEAEETISGLENDKAALQAKVDELSHLDKEAAETATVWDNSGMGEVSNTPTRESHDGESALDNFLND